ncbi:hypothetical protein DM860_012667 [Cuscuta australis]|uniref:Uncharacterized protein n=1 Tax=Cuscuta australis TaxID=267555 RepID=A0A328DDE6_9ASTE|nr:hypothetical protein DM860_012667 [Cuscuta australis]
MQYVHSLWYMHERFFRNSLDASEWAIHGIWAIPEYDCGHGSQIEVNWEDPVFSNAMRPWKSLTFCSDKEHMTDVWSKHGKLQEYPFGEYISIGILVYNDLNIQEKVIQACKSFFLQPILFFSNYFLSFVKDSIIRLNDFSIFFILSTLFYKEYVSIFISKAKW